MSRPEARRPVTGRRLDVPGRSIHSRIVSPARKRRPASLVVCSVSLSKTLPRSMAVSARERDPRRSAAASHLSKRQPSSCSLTCQTRPLFCPFCFDAEECLLCINFDCSNEPYFYDTAAMAIDLWRRDAGWHDELGGGRRNVAHISVVDLARSQSDQRQRHEHRSALAGIARRDLGLSA